MTELEAMKLGYDRKGSCGCHWSSIYHGIPNHCPEHGQVVVTRIMRIDEMYKEYKILAKSRQI